jgi:hypothetical protein
VEKQQENNYQKFIANLPAIAQKVTVEKIKRMMILSFALSTS